MMQLSVQYFCKAHPQNISPFYHRPFQVHTTFGLQKQFMAKMTLGAQFVCTAVCF